LIFGLGLVLGFALIVAEMPAFALAASAIMALGLVGLPIGLAMDGRIAFIQRVLARFSPKKRAKPRRSGRAAAIRVVGRPARRRQPARAPRRRRR